MPQLENKIAIVTGAGSGFGAGIARAYVAEGAQVVLADINPESVQQIAGDLGANAAAFACDVSDGAQIQALVDHCVATFGNPDIVVNNAGITHDNGPMTEVDETIYDRIFAVNVKSIYHMARAVVPLMRGQGQGVILNIGSTAGIRPRPGLTWDNGTKGAVNVISKFDAYFLTAIPANNDKKLASKSMAVELAPDKIRVNAICPVIGETGLTTQFMGGTDTPEVRARFLATIPLGRFSQPRDIAAVAVFLASDAAAFVTGIEFPVDGGRVV